MSAGNEIGDLLLDIGLVTQDELATAHQEQAKTGERLTLIFERLGLVSYHQLKDALELQFGVNFYSLSKTPPAKEVADVLSLETKLKHKVIPVANAGTQFTIAMVNPDDLIALDSVRVELKSGHLKKVVCTADEFEFFIKDMYKVNKDGSNSEPAKAAPAAAKPAGAKMPAKNQLQSLFDDDDEDDDDDLAPPIPVVRSASASASASAAASATPVSPAASETKEPATAPEAKAPAAAAEEKIPALAAEERAPALAAETKTPDLSSLAKEPADAAESSPTLTSSAASAAEVATASATPSRTPATTTPHTPHHPSTAEHARTKPAASVTSNSLPAMTRDIMLGPSASQSIPKEVVDDLKRGVAGDKHKDSQAGPSNGSSPPAVPDDESINVTTIETPIVKPAIKASPKAAGEAASQVSPAASAPAPAEPLPIEISIEDVVAGVASEIVESTESSPMLSNNALLEEVVESELGGLEETDINKLKEQQNSSIMLLAHEIIGKATQKRCSDIHLEPDANGVTLRYFLHGELLADCVLPGEIHGALVSSYKIIAGLDPDELEKPQDKKITTKVEDDQVELRVTTLPSKHGEMVAISMRFVES